MSTVPSLEERYRRLLRALPEPARSRWSDEMTETYLEATCADDPEFAEFGSPDLTDRLDVWQLALRLRLGGPGASARAVLTGATVRWVALLGVLGTAAPAGFAQVASTLSPELTGPTTWQLSLSTVVAVLAVALFGCLVHGSWAARPLAGGLLLLHLFGLVVSIDAPTAVGMVLQLLGLALPLVAAVAVEPERATRPGRWWTGAVGAVALVVAVPLASTVLPFVWTTEAALAVGLALVGIGATLLGAAPAAGASAVLAVLHLPPTLTSVLAGGLPAEYAAGQATVAALLVLAATAGGVSAVRAARQLPSPTA
jgi:hypothetical protein